MKNILFGVYAFCGSLLLAIPASLPAQEVEMEDLEGIILPKEKSMPLRGDNFYQIGHVRFYPEERIVAVGQMYGGVTWDGYGYFPDKRVKYDSTTLVFIGKQYTFTEYLPQIDWATFEIVYDNIQGRLNGYSVYRDKNNFYRTGSSQWGNGIHSQSIPASLKPLGKYLYQDEEGKIYALSVDIDNYNLLKLDEIKGVELDVPTLKHLADCFFTDKNGLYWIGYYRQYFENSEYEDGTIRKLESSDGEDNIVTRAESRFITYGKYVYTRENSLWYTKKLDLNAENTRSFDNFFITDGTNTYYYHKFLPELAGIDTIRQLSGHQAEFTKDNSGNLYFYGSKVKGENVWGTLLLTKEGRYIFIDGKKGIDNIKISSPEKVFIYYDAIKDFEEMDHTQYRYLKDARDIYSYKGALYQKDNRMLTNTKKLDYNNLAVFKPDNIHDYSYFYTDRKVIFSCEDPRLLYGKGEDDGWMVEVKDFPSLRFVNEVLLLDKENVYSANNRRELSSFPLSGLNLKVEVY